MQFLSISQWNFLNLKVDSLVYLESKCLKTAKKVLKNNCNKMTHELEKNYKTM